MVGEELIPILGLNVVTAIGRGIRSYLKHRKASKDKFNYLKFGKSVAAFAGFSLAIQLLVSYFGVDTNSASVLVGEVAASWGLTDATEDLWPKKK